MVGDQFPQIIHVLGTANWCLTGIWLPPHHLDAGTPQGLQRVQGEFVKRHSTGTPWSIRATCTRHRCLHACKALPPYAGSRPLQHLHRSQAHHLRLPAEAGQMLTEAIQSSWLHCTIQDWQTAHLSTGLGDFTLPVARFLHVHIDTSRLHILPHCSRPFDPLARRRPHPRHHSRHCGKRPTDQQDIPLRLSADHHHRPGTSVWISTLPLPDQAV
jgi:hypothetical protein